MEKIVLIRIRLLAPIAGLAIGVALFATLSRTGPVEGHVDLSGNNGYLWNSSCTERKDPINLIFANASYDEVMQAFDANLPDWAGDAYDHGNLFFRDGHGSCVQQNAHRDAGEWHARFRAGHDPDSYYGNYVLAAAHRDTGIPHAGVDFDLARDGIAEAFEGNYQVEYVNVGNTASACSVQYFGDPICDHSDGWVAVIWVGPRPTPIPTSDPTTCSTASGDRMQSGQCLPPGQSITSPNGCYNFIYQTDGNLVLYRVSNRQALWASNTAGSSAGKAIMQTDGNLVVYNAGGTALWASNTVGNPGSWLRVQDDGNVVIYRTNGTAAWATNTVQSPCAAPPTPTPTPPSPGSDPKLRCQERSWNVVVREHDTQDFTPDWRNESVVGCKGYDSGAENDMAAATFSNGVSMAYTSAVAVAPGHSVRLCPLSYERGTCGTYTGITDFVGFGFDNAARSLYVDDAHYSGPAPSDTAPCGDQSGEGLYLFQGSDFQTGCLVRILRYASLSNFPSTAHSFRRRGGGDWQLCGSPNFQNCVRIPQDFGPDDVGNLDNQPANGPRLGGNIGSVRDTSSPPVPDTPTPVLDPPTNTPVTPSFTNTPTRTSTPTRTNTPGGPMPTNTPFPTNTRTRTPTATPSLPNGTWVEMSNVDDTADLFVNGQHVATVGYGDAQTIDISSLVSLPSNSIRFRVTNGGGGYTYRFTVTIDDVVFFHDECGTAGVVGCNNNDYTQGVVYDTKVKLGSGPTWTPSTTSTPTRTATRTATWTPGGPTATPTRTPTITPIPSATWTPGGPPATPSRPPTFTPTRTLTPTRTPTPTADDSQAGDASCDGRTTSVDAAMVLQETVGLMTSLPCGQNADVNRDGVVNAVDAALILQYVAGLLNSLPV